ncbi:uncharacterized protein LOC125722384 isoform X2 [Brienomyrus brachyistius]|uniref:uncharacterized protein LOC125722384 isoform X2 n=1 Tax=Brienomyrus brachyistius TaxID=42636 RepID=UPI0020B1FC31|nr:uncharacterized protein LOC125722384 isoform X2 [Brienomyrus brachyistius]
MSRSGNTGDGDRAGNKQGKPGKDSNSRTVVQQPVSDTLQPGDSVSLQCTIETGSCAGEHSVYWFRHGSGESLPGVIYSHGNSSDECEKSPEAGSPTWSCIYSLPKGNLSLSDAGTYYCAVAMCGEMLFGSGTQLDIDGFQKLLDPLHSGLLIVLSCSIILNVALICIRCKLTCTHCAGCHARLVRYSCVPRPLLTHVCFPDRTQLCPFAFNQSCVFKSWGLIYQACVKQALN